MILRRPAHLSPQAVTCGAVWCRFHKPNWCGSRGLPSAYRLWLFRRNVYL